MCLRTSPVRIQIWDLSSTMGPLSQFTLIPTSTVIGRLEILLRCIWTMLHFGGLILILMSMNFTSILMIEQSSIQRNCDHFEIVKWGHRLVPEQQCQLSTPEFIQEYPTTSHHWAPSCMIDLIRRRSSLHRSDSLATTAIMHERMAFYSFWSTHFSLTTAFFLLCLYCRRISVWTKVELLDVKATGGNNSSPHRNCDHHQTSALQTTEKTKRERKEATQNGRSEPLTSDLAGSILGSRAEGLALDFFHSFTNPIIDFCPSLWMHFIRAIHNLHTANRKWSIQIHIIFRHGSDKLNKRTVRG